MNKKQKPTIPCSKNFFKLLIKEKLDKYEKQALYLLDKVFVIDAEYQKLRKKSKIKAEKITLSRKMQKIRDIMKNAKMQGSYKKIWHNLGKICIECGKCTVACPTCFCFRFEDLSNRERKRVPDSCFFRDFSEVAGGHKFLNSTAQKIYFWYYHKFVRIPEEYNLPGCVECGKCTKACPVNIDIKKVLNKILKT
ncbi:hypothetical protein CL633_00715 [bacterium]|nr:hypothetical protein [bacterium]|tara:strand:- start:2845 stop:3426 length:582 start_codon:yes stop_codon:yes gene_type:complete